MPDFFICYNGDVMKRYPFDNRESCLKFLTYLNVDVLVPDEDFIISEHRKGKITYCVFVDGRECLRASMEIQSENRVKTYIFYSKQTNQEVHQPKSPQSREEQTELNMTIKRLRQAYQQIKSNKEG